MALKAGTVGLDPKYVDKNGAPISQDMPVDAYTKAETDVLLEAKADLTSLRANSKTFQFAYSGGKYGYKAGSTGDFHPFEEAGVTCYGWVKPANLSGEGITSYSGTFLLSSGGYYVANDIVYVDVIVSLASDYSGTNATALTLPEELKPSMIISGIVAYNADATALDPVVSNIASLRSTINSSGNVMITTGSSRTFTAGYYRVCAVYMKSTT